MDHLTRERRSWNMSRIRSTDTALERTLRTALWKKGIRYRRNTKLPGKPDIVLPKEKIAIFIDGCFWHGCPLHSRIPKSNVEYWGKKISRNRERDRETAKALQQDGWTVVRFWGHEILEDSEKVVSQILRIRGRAVQ